MRFTSNIFHVWLPKHVAHRLNDDVISTRTEGIQFKKINSLNAQDFTHKIVHICILMVNCYSTVINQGVIVKWKFYIGA